MTYNENWKYSTYKEKWTEQYNHSYDMFVFVFIKPPHGYQFRRNQPESITINKQFNTICQNDEN